MSLAADELVAVSEAVREPLALVARAAAGMSDEQEAALLGELGKYKAKKDEIEFEVKGGVTVATKSLLDEIRQRIRTHLGWTSAVPLSPYAGGISRGDKQSDEADADGVRPAFTRGDGVGGCGDLRSRWP